MKAPAQTTQAERVAGKLTDKLMKSPSFFGLPQSADGVEFFYFRRPGDMVYGLLMGKHSNQSLYRNCSYRLCAFEIRRDGKILDVPETGTVIDVPGCAILQRILDRAQLIRSRIRIEYKGRVKRRAGRSYKIFEVWKDKGTFHSRQEKQDGEVRTRRKRTASNGRGCVKTRRLDRIDNAIAAAGSVKRSAAERARARGRAGTNPA